MVAQVLLLSSRQGCGKKPLGMWKEAVGDVAELPLKQPSGMWKEAVGPRPQSRSNDPIAMYAGVNDFTTDDILRSERNKCMHLRDHSQVLNLD